MKYVAFKLNINLTQKKIKMNSKIKLIDIDSFCGAGGVTEGFHRAEIDGHKTAKVVIGINHDAMAIESHKENHPDTFHFVEDFTELDPHKLVDIIKEARLQYTNAKVLFWASAECTHHSKAKGGLPRDADSRSLPEHIERYVRVIHPDIIGVEKLDNPKNFVWAEIDEKKCNWEDVAKNDGLSFDDFCEWFSVRQDKPMAVIHFTNFMY
jgi:DNA (cytosine-5)-methyltransferase 1